MRGGLQWCRRCEENPRWGHSPVCLVCLSSAELVVNAAGIPMDVQRTNGRQSLFAARYRYRGVRCGKRGCRSCPHVFYVYRCWRADGVAREKYLGPSAIGEPLDVYVRPQLRRAGKGWGR